MRLVRKHDWPTRLFDYVAASREAPFAWGSNDCCMFAAGCVLAMTGVDPASVLRERYRSKSGALRCLKEFGGAGLQATVERIVRELRMPEILPMQAQRGDVLLLDAPECPPEFLALGVCVGVRIAAQGPQGLTFVPLARGKRAWRV